MGCGRNMCDPDRPDILRTTLKPPVCGDRCGDCSDDCKVEEECACPVHLTGNCVHYNGCRLFMTGINPGDTLDEVLFKINDLFEQADRLFDSQKEEIIQLQTRVRDLEKQLSGKEGCVDGF